MVNDTVDNKDNLEEKTREDADIRMYYICLNVICCGNGGWHECFLCMFLTCLTTLSTWELVVDDIRMTLGYSTIFFLYPPNWTKLNLTFIEQKPKLSEQSLPHQWRFTRVFMSPFDALEKPSYAFSEKSWGFVPNGQTPPPPPYLPPRGGIGIKLFWAIYLFFKKCYHFWF